jgi:hypothetical protein
VEHTSDSFRMITFKNETLIFFSKKHVFVAAATGSKLHYGTGRKRQYFLELDSREKCSKKSPKNPQKYMFLWPLKLLLKMHFGIGGLSRKGQDVLELDTREKCKKKNHKKIHKKIV